MKRATTGSGKSLNRQLDVIKTKLAKHYEAIESGRIELHDVAERIRELKERREQITTRLEEIKSSRTIPLHFFKEDSIAAFQQTPSALLGDGKQGYDEALSEIVY